MSRSSLRRGGRNLGCCWHREGRGIEPSSPAVVSSKRLPATIPNLWVTVNHMVQSQPHGQVQPLGSRSTTYSSCPILLPYSPCLPNLTGFVETYFWTRNGRNWETRFINCTSNHFFNIICKYILETQTGGNHFFFSRVEISRPHSST
jgi:hypothetical protein